MDRSAAFIFAALNLGWHLPRAEVITTHLSPCMSYTRVEDDALRLGYVSPCGVSLAWTQT